MHRSKKIVVVCHCLLNANAKVYPLARCKGVYRSIVDEKIDDGLGLVQLPCPETAYLGVNRWGMTYEQYDNLFFRDFCHQLLKPSLFQIRAFADAGYELSGVIGMDGSPNCGVNRTCKGFSGGEIGTPGLVESQNKNLTFTPGKGVFMETLSELLRHEQIDIPFSAIDEEESFL
jgi:predicted secreted protein